MKRALYQRLILEPFPIRPFLDQSKILPGNADGEMNRLAAHIVSCSLAHLVSTFPGRTLKPLHVNLVYGFSELSLFVVDAWADCSMLRPLSQISDSAM